MALYAMYGLLYGRRDSRLVNLALSSPDSPDRYLVQQMFTQASVYIVFESIICFALIHFLCRNLERVDELREEEELREEYISQRNDENNLLTAAMEMEEPETLLPVSAIGDGSGGVPIIEMVLNINPDTQTEGGDADERKVAHVTIVGVDEGEVEHALEQGGEDMSADEMMLMMGMDLLEGAQTPTAPIPTNSVGIENGLSELGTVNGEQEAAASAKGGEDVGQGFEYYASSLYPYDPALATYDYDEALAHFVEDYGGAADALAEDLHGEEGGGAMDAVEGAAVAAADAVLGKITGGGYPLRARGLRNRHLRGESLATHNNNTTKMSQEGEPVYKPHAAAEDAEDAEDAADAAECASCYVGDCLVGGHCQADLAYSEWMSGRICVADGGQVCDATNGAMAPPTSMPAVSPRPGPKISTSAPTKHAAADAADAAANAEDEFKPLSDIVDMDSPPAPSAAPSHTSPYPSFYHTPRPSKIESHLPEEGSKGGKGNTKKEVDDGVVYEQEGIDGDAVQSVGDGEGDTKGWKFDEQPLLLQGGNDDDDIYYGYDYSGAIYYKDQPLLTQHYYIEHFDSYGEMLDVWPDASEHGTGKMVSPGDYSTGYGSGAFGSGEAAMVQGGAASIPQSGGVNGTPWNHFGDWPSPELFILLCSLRVCANIMQYPVMRRIKQQHRRRANANGNNQTRGGAANTPGGADAGAEGGGLGDPSGDLGVLQPGGGDLVSDDPFAAAAAGSGLYLQPLNALQLPSVIVRKTETFFSRVPTPQLPQLLMLMRQAAGPADVDGQIAEAVGTPTPCGASDSEDESDHCGDEEGLEMRVMNSPIEDMDSTFHTSSSGNSSGNANGDGSTQEEEEEEKETETAAAGECTSDEGRIDGARIDAEDAEEFPEEDGIVPSTPARSTAPSTPGQTPSGSRLSAGLPFTTPPRHKRRGASGSGGGSASSSAVSTPVTGGKMGLCIDSLCFVCMDQVADAVLMECGHGGICYDCARHCITRGNQQCPVCRARIDQVIRFEVESSRIVRSPTATPVSSPQRDPPILALSPDGSPAPMSGIVFGSTVTVDGMGTGTIGYPEDQGVGGTVNDTGMIGAGGEFGIGPEGGECEEVMVVRPSEGFVVRDFYAPDSILYDEAAAEVEGLDGASVLVHMNNRMNNALMGGLRVEGGRGAREAAGTGAGARGEARPPRPPVVPPPPRNGVGQPGARAAEMSARVEAIEAAVREEFEVREGGREESEVQTRRVLQSAVDEYNRIEGAEERKDGEDEAGEEEEQEEEEAEAEDRGRSLEKCTTGEWK
jgi:hypothetical protein